MKRCLSGILIIALMLLMAGCSMGYSVNFYGADGNLFAVYTSENGKVKDYPTEISVDKDYINFENWYVDKDLTKQFTNTNINRNLFCYPKFVLKANYSLQIMMSGSMSGIRVNDVCVIKTNVSPSNLKIDDVIAYNQNDYVIIHRIVGIENVDNKILFKTKGDANVSPDSKLIPEEDVIGLFVETCNLIKQLPGFAYLNE